MNVKVTGRHMSVSDAMKTYAEENAERLTHFDARITEVQVLLDFEGALPKAEFIVKVEHAADFVAHDSGKDMYAVIDAVGDKLERQLREHHKKVTKQHHKGPSKGPTEEPTA